MSPMNGARNNPMDTPCHDHAPIPMRMRVHEDRFERVGDFYWRTDDGNRVLWIAIPCRSTLGKERWVLSEWTVDHKNNCGAMWAWNGNVDRPTLTPSLHAVGVWHGYVRDGQLVEAK